MQNWSSEIQELTNYYKSLSGKIPDLEKELAQLIEPEKDVVILLYSRRCLEVIVTDICEKESIKLGKTIPLKGIIDKLNKEEKAPSHIITSMLNLNSISTYGAHPKEFDPRQVRTVLINLTTIIEWYLNYKDIEISNLIENKFIGDVESTDQLNVPDRFFDVEYDKNENIQFNLFQIFVNKLFPKKHSLFWVFTFFIVLSPAIIVVWAFITGVWSGIDYPLSESYSTWIGEFVLAIINIMILSYYKELSYLMQFSTKYRRLAGNANWQILILVLSFGFSYYLHHNYTTDTLYGWCESDSGTLSYLGYYHSLVFSVQIWILINFIINIYFTKKIINEIRENELFKQNGLLFYKKGVVKKLSNIIIKYVILLLVTGLYMLTFLFTIYHFIEKKESFKVPVDTGIVEIGYLSFYLVFGIGFFWVFIVKPIINLLESNKKKLIQRYPNSNRITSLKILPYEENPFEYLTIFFLAIVSIVVISVISIMLINKIINSELIIA
ncbi:MAG: hypothetical protein DRI95_13600 [Bacteroidetes bacterium]|nr:MAG: hypothetical protein DRI95_13600 [Bacteroidota bacterium]